MISEENCVQMGEKIKKYVMRSKERLFGVLGKGIENGESGKEYKKRSMDERKENLEKKQVHGSILSGMKEVGVKETWQMIQGGYILNIMAGFVMTRLRLCIIVQLGMQSCLRDHTKGVHDKMDLRVYWELCEKHGVGCAKKWFEEIPNTVRISKDLLSNQTTIDPMYLSSVGEILSGLLWNSLCLETRILFERGRKY